MTARVSEKGQVTIPKKLRERLGIKPGQLLDFSEDHGKLVIKKTSAKDEDPIERVYGILKHLGKTTDEIITELRGEPDGL